MAHATSTQEGATIHSSRTVHAAKPSNDATAPSPSAHQAAMARPRSGRGEAAQRPTGGDRGHPPYPTA